MTNRARGVLYIGVTAILPDRIWQHRTGKGSAFCRRYKLTRLVYAEQHDSIQGAIAREKAMKAWKREWKDRKQSAVARPVGFDECVSGKGE